MTRRSGLTLPLVLLVALTAACTSAPDVSVPTYILDEVPCPADVSSTMVGTPQCAELLAPEGGKDPNRTIRLLVTRIRPTDGVKHEDPVLVVSWGAVPNYGGLAPMADRVGREVIMMDARGSGHSRPSLDCPEVDDVAPALSALPTHDPTASKEFGHAVRQCFERISATADTSAYDDAHAVTDVLALVNELGLRTWNAASYGAGSRVALRLLDERPSGLRSMVLDSPELPDSDPRSTAGRWSARAMLAILNACSRADSCTAPVTGEQLQDILERYAASPVARTVTVQGNQRSVLYDDVMVARLLRYVMSSGASAGAEFSPAGIPSLLRALDAGQLSTLDRRITEQIASDPPYCVGYLPKCEANNHTSLGTYLTQLCSSPTIPRTEPPADTDPWTLAFDNSPYTSLCDKWPTPPQHETWSPALGSGVPLLVITGSYDPFSDPSHLQRALSSHRELTFVNIPWAGHNVLGELQCAIDLRNRWLDDPRATNHCPDKPPTQYFLNSIN